MFRDNTTFRPCMLYIQVYIHTRRSVWKRIRKDKFHKNSAPAATGKKIRRKVDSFPFLIVAISRTDQTNLKNDNELCEFLLWFNRSSVNFLCFLRKISPYLRVICSVLLQESIRLLKRDFRLSYNR